MRFVDKDYRDSECDESSHLRTSDMEAHHNHVHDTCMPALRAICVVTARTKLSIPRCGDDIDRSRRALIEMAEGNAFTTKECTTQVEVEMRVLKPAGLTLSRVMWFVPDGNPHDTEFASPFFVFSSHPIQIERRFYSR